MKGETARALAATVVAIVDREQQDEAVHALVALSRASAIQPIVISLGSEGNAPREDHDGVVVYTGLLPRYLNNAVASLRLSSLPALGWWRARDTQPLPDLALLVDRLLLDLSDPVAQWQRVGDLAQLTAVSDVRWARLTRWRDLVAQFFDLPDVRGASAPFGSVELVGSDAAQLALFAGWLKTRLPGGSALRVERQAGTAAPLERATLVGDAGCVTLALLPHSACLETSLESGDRIVSTRIVAAGDTRLETLLRGELRIRARDLAFEDAAREASGL